HTGISLSQILYRLADALEAGEDAHQARQAASAGPKATANLLAWLPVAGIGLAHMLGASIPIVDHPNRMGDPKHRCGASYRWSTMDKPDDGNGRSTMKPTPTYID